MDKIVAVLLAIAGLFALLFKRKSTQNDEVKKEVSDLQVKIDQNKASLTEEEQKRQGNLEEAKKEQGKNDQKDVIDFFDDKYNKQ